MIKKGGALLVLFLLAGMFIMSVSFVSAGDFTDSMKSFFSLNSDVTTSALFVKWLFLFLIIALIYSVLSMANFPPNDGVKFLIAIIVGFLAGAFFTTPELVAMIESYKALGVTLYLFIPIMILVFFSYAVAKKADPFGLFAQKILWIIYSVYLFIRVGGMFLYRWLGGTGTETLNLKSGFLVKFFNLFFKTDNTAYGQGDTTLLLIQAIVAIAVFIIFVLGNKSIERWFMATARNADIESMSDEMARAQGLRRAEAEATRRAGR